MCGLERIATNSLPSGDDGGSFGNDWEEPGWFWTALEAWCISVYEHLLVLAVFYGEFGPATCPGSNCLHDYIVMGENSEVVWWQKDVACR